MPDPLHLLKRKIRVLIFITFDKILNIVVKLKKMIHKTKLDPN